MQKIAKAIQDGASAYLNRQYRMIALVGVSRSDFADVVSRTFGRARIYYRKRSLGNGRIHWDEYFCSRQCSNGRSGQRWFASGIRVAFRSGAITGFLVVGLALLGIVIYYLVLQHLQVDQRKIFEALVALSFGASLISIFARLGGGIFTKGADVGADLVGKIEAGIPEDDPRNPAVISDNVGDNVGDCAGMAADLFETYVVTIVGTMLLGKIFFTGLIQEMMIMFPLAIGGVCIISSILGSFFVRLGKKANIMAALYKGFIASAIISVGAIGWLIQRWLGFDSTFEIQDHDVYGNQPFYLHYCGIGRNGTHHVDYGILHIDEISTR